MICAVIFDVDGLLIDSEPLWRVAEINTFETVGIRLTDEQCKKTTGLRLDATVQYWYEQYPWSNKTREQVCLDIGARVVELIVAEGRSLPGADATIALFDRLQIPIGLCSSSPYAVLNAVVQRLGFAGSLQAIHSAEDDPDGKPHPAPYISAARKLGVEPQFCLAFEDSLNGAIAAKAARMKVVAVPEVRSTKFDFCDLNISALSEFSMELFTELGGRDAPKDPLIS